MNLLTTLAADLPPSSFVQNALLTVMFFSQVVLGWAVLTGKAQKREMGPQPFAVSAVHDAVTQPEFKEHKKEIWDVTNGIRRDVAKALTAIEKVGALREQNGERLDRFEAHFAEINRTIGELIAAVHALNRHA